MKLVVLPLLTIVIVSLCSQPPPVGDVVENFMFETKSDSCSAGYSEVTGSANVELDSTPEHPNLMRFSGCVITPTPCHNLTASYDVQRDFSLGDIVSITVTAVPNNDVCIQVLDSKSFQGNFTINSLKYQVNIIYNGQEIGGMAAIA